jgi:splicing factor 3B subunit 5
MVRDSELLSPCPLTTCVREWLTHQHRDTLASIVGHPTLTSYLSIADGVAVGRTKFEMMEVSFSCGSHIHRSRSLQRMLQPCGPPPSKDEE